MSWHYLPGLAVEYSEASCQAGAPSAQWKRSRIAGKCSSDANGTVCYPCSRSGTISEPSTENHGEEWLTSYRAAFRAKISLVLVKGQVSKENDQDCGENLLVSFAKYSHDTHSWKTPQCSLLAGLDEYSETWPRWGMMRNGVCWERDTSVPRIKEIGSGYLPTPAATEYGTNQGGAAGRTGKIRPSLSTMARKNMWPTPTSSMMTMGDLEQARFAGNDPNRPKYQEANRVGGTLNPLWVEWLMGWPTGWTDLEPLEMDKFRQWLRSHGRS